MEGKQRKIFCGHCGCETVRLFTDDQKVFAECTECYSTSELVVVGERPKIEFRFGAKSQGVLCVKKDPTEN